MNNIWVTYTVVTVVYIGLLMLFFWRKTKKHESELKDFLDHAKKQLELHKTKVHQSNKQKMTKVMAAMSIMQQVAIELDKELNTQYKKLVEEAKEESEKIKQQAQKDAEAIRLSATHDLDDYRAKRLHEIEADLVRLVCTVSEKVLNKSLTHQDHVDLIYKSLEEIKLQKQKM